MTIKDDVSDLTEESFENVKVFHMSEITKDNFKEEIKRFQIMELQRQQMLLAQRLQSLIGDAPYVPQQLPTIPSDVSLPINNTASVKPVSAVPPMINPKTKRPYTSQEVDAVYVLFDQDMLGRSEDVIMTVNNGDHFVVVVHQKAPNFPRNIQGIPIVQMLEEEHMNLS
jgi:hypothetical protein